MALQIVAAISICAAASALEAWLSGPRPFAFLRSLQQPAWALPLPAWLAVGIAFYAIMATALARLFAGGGPASLGVASIILVLVSDAFWNALLFRLRRLDLAYLYLFPYSLVVIGAAVSVYFADPVSSLLIAVSVIFLPYDFAWVRALRRMNPEFDRR
jgi:tryptophan-rich sensory protein